MTSKRDAAANLLRRTVLENPWIPSKPTLKQARFLVEPSYECLFGGAAGGGKSEAMLMAAAQFVEIPGYSALILRRTYPQLAQDGGLIPRSHEWWQGTDAKWHSQDKRWTFPSGATISFGHLQHENNKYDYQSGEYAFVGFEELTQFTESQYLYLFSRVRRTHDSPFPIRIRATTNPGGIGHKWVKARFIDSVVPDRSFIPSLLADNPHLNAEEYAAALVNLDDVTRKQLQEGDWSVSPHSERIFENVTIRTITDEEIANLARFYHGVDWGYYPHPWVYEQTAWEPNTRTVYFTDEAFGTRMSPEQTAAIVKEKAGTELVVCDSAEGQSIAGYVAAGIRARPVKKGKGSVQTRIRWFQSVNIVIDPARNPLAAQQFTEYEFIRGRDGEYLEGYPDEGDDSIDAAGYGLAPVIMARP